MPPAAVTCPGCGAALPGGQRFCSACGTDVGGDTARISTATTAPPAAGAASAFPDPLFERLRAATLGEYEVYGELGRGGMAAVYLAHDIALDRKVAIKVMLPELLTGEGMVERFKREARTAGALSHPHIIPVYAVKETAGMLFFVMKCVEGRGLDSVIRELGPLPLPMVQTIVSQVAGALAHAHRKNVVHRDIKPANVMIDEDGAAVVTDFGIAKIQDASKLTGTGAAIGTPFYMSPEQASGQPVTGASDQYSLGITAYEMLTGVTPFVGASMMEVLSGHFFNAPEPVRTKRPDCPEALEAIVLRMIAKDPKSRFASLEEVVTAVAAPQLAYDDPVRTQMVTLAKSAARQRPRMSVPVSPAPPARRPSAPARTSAPAADGARPRPRSRAWIIAGVLGAAGIAVGMWLWTSRGPTGTAPSRVTAATTLPQPSVAPAPLQAVPPTTSGTQSETGRRTRALNSRRDSIARAAADSVARARQDSLAGARADSIVRARTESTTRAARPLPAPKPPEDTAVVVLGTRAAGAVFYVDGVARGVLSRLRRLTVRAGSVRLAINAEGCTAWDSTLTLASGQVLSLGYRQPRCP